MTNAAITIPWRCMLRSSHSRAACKAPATLDRLTVTGYDREMNRPARLAPFCAAFAVLGASSVAFSAPPVPTTTIVMQGRSLSPKLVSRLATTKTVADPQKLAAAYVSAGTKTQLKLANGRLITLDPPAKPVAITPSVRARTVVPPELTKYKPYYEAMTVEPLAENTAMVIAMVDHTARQTAVKDQQSRGSCVSFALAATMESHLRWKGSNVQHDISEEHMFKMLKDSENVTCNDGGFWYHDAWPVLDGKKVCSESQQPYAAPSECVTSSACTTGAAYSWKSALMIPYTKEPTTKGLEASNTKLLEALLEVGYDVAIGVGVAGTMWGGTAAASGVIDVELQSNGAPVDIRGSHA